MKPDEAVADFERILKFIFRESEEGKQGGREFTSVNDRPTTRSMMKLSRNLKSFEVYFS